MRREPAAVLARALFFVTFWKNHRNPPNFGNFSRKKISKFLYQNWIVHGWYKNQKMSKILEILSNFARNEILVFFVLKVPQDAMFDKNRFFQTFSSNSKVRGTQKWARCFLWLVNTNRTRQWYGPEVPHNTGSPSGWVKTARQLLRYLRIQQMTPCQKLNHP